MRTPREATRRKVTKSGSSGEYFIARQVHTCALLILAVTASASACIVGTPAKRSLNHLFDSIALGAR